MLWDEDPRTGRRSCSDIPRPSRIKGETSGVGEGWQHTDNPAA